MARVIYALAVGLVGAGILHIVVLLLLPHFSERDAWARLARASALYNTTLLDRMIDGEPVIRTADPATRAVACRFDLSDGAMMVSAPGGVPFWSASIYDRSGSNVYSLNDRLVPENALDLVVLTPDQMAALQKDTPEDFEESTFVEVPLSEGILVVRTIVPDASWEPTVANFLDRTLCVPR